MAWMNQEQKQALAPAIKAVLKKYGIKGTIAVKDHSVLVVNIKSGVIDFINDYNTKMLMQPKHEFWKPVSDSSSMCINQYWYQEHFSESVVKFFDELFAAMKGDKWFDKSDIQSDYFNVAYYLYVNVGSWDKPYVVEQE